MKKVEDYLRYAAECRDMARTASAAHLQQLEQIAEAWERLAKAGKDQLDERGAARRYGSLVCEAESAGRVLGLHQHGLCHFILNRALQNSPI
jgi:hypothetical protein